MTEIVERLERQATNVENDGHVSAARAMREAATQLAALSARVKELERDAEAFHRHEQTLRDNGIASHSDAVVLVVDLRQQLKLAQQERDDAYERAAKVADQWLKVRGLMKCLRLVQSQMPSAVSRQALRRRRRNELRATMP